MIPPVVGCDSGLLSEGRWFDSPGLHVEMSLGKMSNPKLLLMCWLAPCIEPPPTRLYQGASPSSQDQSGYRHLVQIWSVLAPTKQ